MKNILSKTSFRIQLGSLFALFILSISTCYYFYEKSTRLNDLKVNYVSKTKLITKAVKLGFEVGLNNENFKSINKAFDWAKSQTNLKWIVITDAEDSIFAKYPPNLKIELNTINKRLINNSIENLLFLLNENWKTKEDHGKIYIAFDTSVFTISKEKLNKEILTTVLILVLITLIITLSFSYSISSPLNSLYEVTNEIMLGNTHKRALSIGGSIEIDSVSNNFNKMLDQLTEEQKKSNKLLLNILPKKIADRLKDNHKTIADNYYNCSVLFADIVGFTPLSAKLSAEELVSILNKIFSKVDDLAEKYNLEKIKTIGDCYMVAGGLLDKTENHVHNISNMGLEIIDAIANTNQELNLDLHVRVGIHVGPCTAGVIGKQKFIYDLWGDSVNTASRMESHGLADKVHVSEDVYNLIKNDFKFEKREPMNVKGKGLMQTYFLSK